MTFAEGARTLCTAPVDLLAAAPTAGSAVCAASLPAGSHTITITAGGAYTATAPAQVAILVSDGSFVTGGGFLRPTSSAGRYAAKPGSQISFDLQAKPGKKGKDASGDVKVQFRSGSRDYEIRGTSVASLGVQDTHGVGRADVRLRATLTDVTSGKHSGTVATGLTLQVSLTDRGEPGRHDTLAITVWDGSTLVFSSDWSGAATREIALGGGNTVVH